MMNNCECSLNCVDINLNLICDCDECHPPTKPMNNKNIFEKFDEQDKNKRKGEWERWGKSWAQRNPEKMKAYRKKYREKNREKIREVSRKKGRERYWANPEKERAMAAESRRKIRQLVLDSYGRICACCGEDEENFLTVDHINGDGAKHRKEIKKKNESLYSWLKRMDFPTTGFQMLCYNCNMSKGHYGQCPHTIKSRLPNQEDE